MDNMLNIAVSTVSSTDGLSLLIKEACGVKYSIFKNQSKTSCLGATTYCLVFPGLALSGFFLVFNNFHNCLVYKNTHCPLSRYSYPYDIVKIRDNQRC